MLVKVVFRVLNLGFINQAHVSEAAVRKFINQRTAYEIGYIIIDDGSYIGSDGRKYNYQKYIQVTVSSGSLIGGGRYYHFRGERDKRAFDGH
jgi:hypothetical protein